MKFTEAAFRKTTQAAIEAHNNERTTRARVDLLEGRAADMETHLAGVGSVLNRSFLGRLRRLVLGR